MKSRDRRSAVRIASVVIAVGFTFSCSGDDPSSTPLEPEAGINAARLGVPGAPTSAVVRFGNNSVGTTEFGPVHPSSHARDNIIPSTVVIPAGGSVTFMVQPPHRVAIYEAGTALADIRLIPEVTLVSHMGPPGPPVIPDFYIDEPDGRIFIEPLPAFAPEHSVEYTFPEPGRYLVICGVAPHFTEFNMYAWVEVR